MNITELIGAAHWTERDLGPLRCLICGCSAETTTRRVTRIEDGCWLAICDDCCEFFGTAGPSVRDNELCSRTMQRRDRLAEQVSFNPSLG